jgi:hypothetical protein
VVVRQNANLTHRNSEYVSDDSQSDDGLFLNDERHARAQAFERLQGAGFHLEGLQVVLAS